MTAGIVLGVILFAMVVVLVAVLSTGGRPRRGTATNSDGSVAFYGGGGDSGCDAGSGGDCGGGGDGGGGGGGD